MNHIFVRIAINRCFPFVLVLHEIVSFAGDKINLFKNGAVKYQESFQSGTPQSDAMD